MDALKMLCAGRKSIRGIGLSGHVPVAPLITLTCVLFMLVCFPYVTAFTTVGRRSND